MSGHFVACGPEECAYLSKKDKRLGEAIASIGPISRPRKPDIFAALVDNIISQQISSKAADTVFARLVELAGDITPQRLLALSQDEIQGCGMTMRKAGYIVGTASAAQDGLLDGLDSLSDTEVIKRLVELPGIGVWTAEMLLIFSLGRPDVLSYGDLAIRRGIQRLYSHKKPPTKAQFERYRRRYSPYGSTASLYLWRLAVEDE